MRLRRLQEVLEQRRRMPARMLRMLTKLTKDAPEKQVTEKQANDLVRSGYYDARPEAQTSIAEWLPPHTRCDSRTLPQHKTRTR